MARPKPTIPQIKKTLHLPQDVVARLELELFSDLEGKIPHGAQSELITKLLRDYFEKLDNTPVLPQ